MKPAQRRQGIIEILFQLSQVTVLDLCERFQCSGGTIRNDLRALEEQGVLIRTFSGAKLSLVRSIPKSTQTHNSSASQLSLAQRAVEMVRDGDVILLCAGFVTLCMAERLLGLKSLTVVTNSVEIAQLLTRNPNYSVILIGGQMRADCNVLDGPAGAAMLHTMRVHKAFIPCDGVTGAQGFACNDVAGAHMRAAMVASAQQVVMLVMPQDVGKPALVSFASIEAADHCITMRDAAPDELALLRSAGVHVSLCGQQSTEVSADGPPEAFRRIGFANLMEDNDFTHAVRQSVEHAAQLRGDIELTLVNNMGNATVALANARTLIEANVDLVIEYQIDERTNHTLMDLFRTAGIPVIAIDIPLPGAVFFGADNFRAGRIAGDEAVRWIRAHWGGKVDRVVCIEQPALGPVPAGRIDGQLEVLRAGLGITDADIVRYECRSEGRDTRTMVTQALRSIPWGRKVLFVGIDAGTALCVVEAAEALDRQSTTAVVSQNLTTRIRAELERGNPTLIGAVDYFPDQYGSEVIRLAADMLQGLPVPPATYTQHRFVGPAHLARESRELA